MVSRNLTEILGRVFLYKIIYSYVEPFGGMLGCVVLGMCLLDYIFRVMHIHIAIAPTVFVNLCG